MKPIGSIIREWRLRKGLRQEDLEAATGLAQAYLSDVERGRVKDPGVIRTSKIVAALGRTLDDLVREREVEAARTQLAAA